MTRPTWALSNLHTVETRAPPTLTRTIPVRSRHCSATEASLCCGGAQWRDTDTSREPALCTRRPAWSLTSVDKRCTQTDCENFVFCGALLRARTIILGLVVQPVGFCGSPSVTHFVDRLFGGVHQIKCRREVPPVGLEPDRLGIRLGKIRVGSVALGRGFRGTDFQTVLFIKNNVLFQESTWRPIS